MGHAHARDRVAEVDYRFTSAPARRREGERFRRVRINQVDEAGILPRVSFGLAVRTKLPLRLIEVAELLALRHLRSWLAHPVLHRFAVLPPCPRRRRTDRDQLRAAFDRLGLFPAGPIRDRTITSIV